MAVASGEQVKNVTCLSAAKSLWISVSGPCLSGSILLWRNSLSLWRSWPATNLSAMLDPVRFPHDPQREDVLFAPDRALSGACVIFRLFSSWRRFGKGRLFSISKLIWILYQRTSLTSCTREPCVSPLFLSSFFLPPSSALLWGPMSLYTLPGSAEEHGCSYCFVPLCPLDSRCSISHLHSKLWLQFMAGWDFISCKEISGIIEHLQRILFWEGSIDYLRDD